MNDSNPRPLLPQPSASCNAFWHSVNYVFSSNISKISIREVSVDVLSETFARFCLSISCMMEAAGRAGPILNPNPYTID